jgi:hypothetical protein
MSTFLEFTTPLSRVIALRRTDERAKPTAFSTWASMMSGLPMVLPIAPFGLSLASMLNVQSPVESRATLLSRALSWSLSFLKKGARSGILM